MANTTLESLLVRVKKEVATKAKESEKKKAAAREERLARQPSLYEREDMWKPFAIHRSYEIQYCDCCKGKSYLFEGDRIELRHRIDKSARKWIRERGELMGVAEFDDQTKMWRIKELPVITTLSERVIPECYDCFSLGRTLNHLWKGKGNEKNQPTHEKSRMVSPSAQEAPRGTPLKGEAGNQIGGGSAQAG